MDTSTQGRSQNLFTGGGGNESQGGQANCKSISMYIRILCDFMSRDFMARDFMGWIRFIGVSHRAHSFLKVIEFFIVKLEQIFVFGGNY